MEASPDLHRIRLTMDGWNKYELLKTSNFDSNHVFIAMWFNKKTNKIREAIKYSIKASGYEPLIADEEDYTGNIMDYILGKIRQSKFVISDFSVEPESCVNLGNQERESDSSKIMGGTRGGVYYETGFARGLGLQVIHLCKDDHQSKNRLHFDIAQENTIFWTDNDVEHKEIRDDDIRSTNPSPKNLSEKLYDRILRVFGRGKLVQL